MKDFKLKQSNTGDNMIWFEYVGDSDYEVGVHSAIYNELHKAIDEAFCDFDAIKLVADEEYYGSKFAPIKYPRYIKFQTKLGDISLSVEACGDTIGSWELIPNPSCYDHKFISYQSGKVCCVDRKMYDVVHREVDRAISADSVMIHYCPWWEGDDMLFMIKTRIGELSLSTSIVSHGEEPHVIRKRKSVENVNFIRGK